VLGLTELSSGEIILGGEQINYKRKKDIKNFRRKIQIVFQNPQRSFNPIYNIRTSVGESLNVRPEWSRKQRQKRIEEVLDAVKINEELRNRRPEQLSGGQLQRVAIARAIAPEPNLIFLDEPTSSLDLSVRSEVLGLLNELQNTLNITYVFVSHDLDVVRAITNNVIVMYRGQIVEEGSSEVLFKNPSHPYTQALLAASEF
jgi:ABC-type microcin C transport system duplicated ATPase subunit YejF